MRRGWFLLCSALIVALCGMLVSAPWAAGQSAQNEGIEAEIIDGGAAIATDQEEPEDAPTRETYRTRAAAGRATKVRIREVDPEPVNRPDPVSTTRPTAEARVNSQARENPRPSRGPATYTAPHDGQLEPARLNGLQPGSSTIAEVDEAWGLPKEVGSRDGMVEHVYEVEPFNRVTVLFEADVVRQITVELREAFPVDVLAKELGLSDIESVESKTAPLGMIYPERAVCLHYADDQPGQVTRVSLSLIEAGPFACRAEAKLDGRYESALADVRKALEIDSKSAVAYWVKGRLLSKLGRQQVAVDAARIAVRLDAGNMIYRLDLARIVDQTGGHAAAVTEARRVLAQGKAPIVQARAHSLLGMLLSEEPEREYRRAAAHHAQAIKLALKLAGDSEPDVRRQAAETLLDSHLGLAYSVAWGDWKNKPAMVEEWLGKANALVESDSASKTSDDPRFRVAAAALAAHVGMQGETDPSVWSKAAARLGDELIEQAADPLRQEQLRWELGLALHDSLQIHYLRQEYAAASKYGQMAVKHLEEVADARQETPGYAYLMGRLYFRMGLIEAIHGKDHAGAVAWFDKARPLLEQPVAKTSWGDVGRQGESLVSMAVSYWECGDREEGQRLTSQGLAFMEQAVTAELMAAESLAVPYGNLAYMHRQLGNAEAAAQCEELAAKKKATTQE